MTLRNTLRGEAAFWEMAEIGPVATSYWGWTGTRGRFSLRAARGEDVEGDYQLEADVECGGGYQSIWVKWGKSDVDRRRRRLRNKLPRWGGTNYWGEVELSTLISDTIGEREVGESENFWYFCLEVTLSTDYITPRQESYTIEPIKWVPYQLNQFMNFLYRLFHDHFVCFE